jgi:hypothetical protein
MSVKQCINRLTNINSKLPLMQRNGISFSEEDVIADVIATSIPAAWVTDFKLAKLHIQIKIRDVMADLVVIKEQIKTNYKPTHDHTNGNNNKKQLKNPCRVHNGGHEWADGHQNPKNDKNNDKNNKIIMTTARGVEMITMVDLVKNTDVPKEMNGNPPETGTVIEATVGLEIVMTQTASMNTIASTAMPIKMKIQMSLSQSLRHISR